MVTFRRLQAGCKLPSILTVCLFPRQKQLSKRCMQPLLVDKSQGLFYLMKEDGGEAACMCLAGWSAAVGEASSHLDSVFRDL